jgi:hypothetical protein
VRLAEKVDAALCLHSLVDVTVLHLGKSTRKTPESPGSSEWPHALLSVNTGAH